MTVNFRVQINKSSITWTIMIKLPELNREFQARSRKSRHRIQNTGLHNVYILACSQSRQLTCALSNTKLKLLLTEIKGSYSWNPPPWGLVVDDSKSIQAVSIFSQSPSISINETKFNVANPVWMQHSRVKIWFQQAKFLDGLVAKLNCCPSTGWIFTGTCVNRKVQN